MALTGPETWVNTGIGTLGGLAGAQISDSQYTNSSSSYGVSGSQAYNYSDSVSNAWSNAWSWEHGRSGSESHAENSDITYGREATALDIMLAAEQNALQRSYWNEAADYNAKQAQIDRDFQAYMSNTAYQRAVADLLAAGLNPILAAGNMGASTPVGAMGSMSSANAYRANVQAQRESYGSSSSSSWSRNDSESGSKSKSHSESHSEGSSSSYSKEGSHSEGQGTSHSEPAYAKAIEAAGSMLNDGLNAAKDIFLGSQDPKKRKEQQNNSKWLKDSYVNGSNFGFQSKPSKA